MPLVKYTGKIHYLSKFCDIAEAFDGIIKLIEEKEEYPCAFDIKWTFSNFKDQSGPQIVAALQLCLDLENCYILQMIDIKKIPAIFTAFLYHPKVIFHGMNIKHKIQLLVKDFPILNADKLIEKCIDLGDFYNEIFKSSEKWTLNRLSMNTLEEKISKARRHLQMYNWKYLLSEIQLLYASINVYVSLFQIFFIEFTQFISNYF